MGLPGGDKVSGQEQFGLDAAALVVEDTGVRTSFDLVVIGTGEAGSAVATECRADMVVHGTGRVPELAGLDLPAAGVEFDPHGVTVDEHLESVSYPAVYAAGDAANSGGLPETPQAQYEGGVVARNLLDENRHRVDYRGSGSVVYTIPPLARVGLTEDEARREGLRFDVHQADTSGWHSARRVEEPASGYKVLVKQSGGMILGAHLLCPEADDLASVFVVAMRAAVPANVLREVLFMYPTQASNMRWMLT